MNASSGVVLAAGILVVKTFVLKVLVLISEGENAEYSRCFDDLLVTGHSDETYGVNV